MNPIKDSFSYDLDDCENNVKSNSALEGWKILRLLLMTSSRVSGLSRLVSLSLSCIPWFATSSIALEDNRAKETDSLLCA